MPLREIVPRDDALVDIVAVHGLNPRGKHDDEHAFDTWRTPAGKDGRLWLQHDIPSDAPSARIFLYEYNSKMVYGGTKGDFVDTANQFLDALYHERKNVRPIH